MSYNSPFTGNVIQPTDVAFRAFTIAANTQLQWPINGNATDDYAARIMDVTASAGGLLLKMPPANQASVGQDALIRNVGATTFTIADYDGNTIVAIAASESKYVYLETNPDEAGTWGNIAFGVGTSNADAGTLAGYGLTAIANTLNQSHPIGTYSTNFTLDDTDRAQTIVWTGGAGTLSLTSAGTLGNNWFVLIRNNGSGTLSITPTGGQLIDSSATLDLQPTDSCFVLCSGTAFFSIGLGRSTEFNFTQLTKAVTSGTYTLTTVEAANVIQKYTGTLSASVTVVVPKTIQVYYISNQTDGTGANYSITFTTGIAGAGTATIPAGQQAILLCDSVNLLNASTIVAGISNIQLANGTAASPSLSFASEANTGIYRSGANQFALSVAGTQRFRATSSGIVVTGSGTFSNGLSVTGSSTFNTGLAVIGTASVTGTVSVIGNVSATGTGTFDGGILGGTFS